MSGDPIADYLSELRAGLRTAPARTAEILAEAEDHLRESAAAVRQAGHLSEAAAQRAAIEAFGPAHQVTRAHRPPLTAFAAAAGLKAWPLLSIYVLLSAVAGALSLWRETASSGGRSIAVVTVTSPSPGGRPTTMLELVGTTHPGQAAAVFGGCALAGVLLVAGFLVVGRRGRRSGLALVRLPRGFVPLVAAFALVVFGMIENQVMRGTEVGWLTRVTGAYELATGSGYAAVLTGIGCAVWALAYVGGDPVEAEGARRDRRPPATAYAVGAATKAGQLVGGYLLLSSLMGGLALYVTIGGTRLAEAWPVAAAFGGCVLAGALLITVSVTVRERRRRSGLAPARLSRGLSLLVPALALAALALAEYKFYGGDVMGTLRVPEGIADLILGSQWAAVLMGASWALRTLVSLVGWVVGMRRASGSQAPPEGGNLAPIG
jgi:hypothetical protein